MFQSPLNPRKYARMGCKYSMETLDIRGRNIAPLFRLSEGNKDLQNSARDVMAKFIQEQHVKFARIRSSEKFCIYAGDILESCPSWSETSLHFQIRVPPPTMTLHHSTRLCTTAANMNWSKHRCVSFASLGETRQRQTRGYTADAVLSLTRIQCCYLP